jgi:hypothetical protein
MVDSDDFQERVVFTGKVDFVTFYLVKDVVLENAYALYTESEQIALRPFGNSFASPLPYDQAMQELRKAMQRLEKTLGKKRNGAPTPNQLHFLFRQKIPIPLTLTWSQASKLIKERLQQIADEKQVLLDKPEGSVSHELRVRRVEPSGEPVMPEGWKHREYHLENPRSLWYTSEMRMDM